MDAEADHEIPAWGRHPVLFLSMVSFLVGWSVLPSVTGSWTDKGDPPYETWWALWALIAATNIPVFGAVGSVGRRYPDSGGGIIMVLLGLLPPGLAMLLLGIAGSCANFSAITGRSSQGCGRGSIAAGWAGLVAGSILLVGAAAYVVYLEPSDSGPKSD